MRRKALFYVALLLFIFPQMPRLSIDVNTEEPMKILVDASKGGGIWWYPQEEPFDPNLPHQGKALADYWRSIGINVTEFPRFGPTITSEILNEYDLVIVIDSSGYSDEEIYAYQNYVSNGGQIFIACDHHGESNKISNGFQLNFAGSSKGSNLVDQFQSHPITFGVDSLVFAAGSGLLNFTEDANIIGWLSNDTYLDLNYNEIWDEGEPYGSPVLGYMYYGAGKILFFGDINGAFEQISQPFTDNYLAWFGLLPSGTYSLTVHVRRRFGDTPIEGVNVTVYRDSLMVDSGVTDENGDALFQVEEGINIIVARRHIFRRLYLTKEETVNITSDTTITFKFII